MQESIDTVSSDSDALLSTDEDSDDGSPPIVPAYSFMSRRAHR